MQKYFAYYNEYFDIMQKYFAYMQNCFAILLFYISINVKIRLKKLSNSFFNYNCKPK